VDPTLGLSEGLKARRAALTDPDAIDGFDALFDRLGRDASRMEQAIAGMEKSGNLSAKLADQWKKSQPKEGVKQEPHGEAVGELPGLQDLVTRVADAIDAYAKAHPEVAGIPGRQKALRAEQARLERILRGDVEATTETIRSIRGNVEGIRAEFEVASGASGVTRVGQAFPLDGIEGKVDVDVIADQGRTWIESKSTEPFGLESKGWAGLKSQAADLLEAATQNPVGGKPPKVVINFRKGVSWEVANALEQMGVEVRGNRTYLPFPSVVPGGVDEEDE
jgi:hypothetical protein